MRACGSAAKPTHRKERLRTRTSKVRRGSAKNIATRGAPAKMTIAPTR
jgi:hypothetical protein